MPGGCSLTEADLEAGLQRMQLQNGSSAATCGAGIGAPSAGRIIPDRTVDPTAPLGTWSRAQTARQKAFQASSGAQSVQLAAPTCRKCTAAHAVAVVRQSEPLCADCLEASITTKLRAATRGRGLLQDGETIMVALSGGVSSMTLLHTLLCVRSASGSHQERRKLRFQLSAVHVDESAARGLSPQQAAAHAEQLHAAVAAIGFTGPLHIVPLHKALRSYDVDADSAGPGTAASSTGADTGAPAGDGSEREAAAASSGAEARLLSLLGSMTDATGRDDLAAAMRHRVLLGTAMAHTCTKLLTGDNASAMAVRVIADSAKGRGYSLAGDIQLADGRAACWGALHSGGGSDAAGSSSVQSGGTPAPPSTSRPGVVVLHPLREVSGQEVAALHTARALPLAEPPQRAAGGPPVLIGAGGRSNLNTLAVDLVDAMQRSLPSSVFTVLRAASHLTPFPFNGPPSAADARRGPSNGGEARASQVLESAVAAAVPEAVCLCAVCGAPVAEVDQQWWRQNSGEPTAAGGSTRVACYSCRHQVLGSRVARSGASAPQPPPAEVLSQLLCELGGDEHMNQQH